MMGVFGLELLCERRDSILGDPDAREVSLTGTFQSIDEGRQAYLRFAARRHRLPNEH
jgi:hypothetical protein